MFIYKIVNKVNGKIYIGKTISTVEKRFKGHIKAYNRWISGGCKSRTGLYRAFLKYGIDNFEVFTIDQAETEEELNEKEIFWINSLNSRDRTVGYNIAEGGKGSWSSAHENWKNLDDGEKDKIRNKISESSKKVIHDKDWCDKISNSLKGHKVRPETREKLSKAKSDRIACYNPDLNKTIFINKDDALNLDKNWLLNTTGVKLSDDVKEKLSNQHRGMKYSQDINMKKGRSKYIFKIDAIESTNWHLIAEYIETTYKVKISRRYIIVKLCTTNTPFQYKKYRHLDFLIDKCSYRLTK